MREAALKTEGLLKNYGRVRALRGLNLEVPAGAVYGLLGVNGAGKTTTLGILAGFLRPSGGEFLVRGRLGCLPQDARLTPNRRIFPQLAFLARLSGIASRSCPGEVLRCLAAVGLEEVARRKPRQLSHGQRRRLSLAQALLGDPEILLLDEPTAGLDPGQAAKIKRLIFRLAGARTVVFSSHRLAEVEELCEMVGVVHEGRMLYQGSTSGLRGAGNLVRYRLSAPGRGGLLRSLPGVRGVRHPPGSAWVSVEFDSEEIVLEELNRQVLTLLHSAGVGIREIAVGGSLEEGFLELLS